MLGDWASTVGFLAVGLIVGVLVWAIIHPRPPR